MRYVITYVKDGKVIHKYTSNPAVVEELKRSGAKIISAEEYVYTKRGVKIKNIAVDKITSSGDRLKQKYGVSLEELQRIVATSQSQPEAIAKLRKRLHGSTKYDLRYFEVEKLLTQLYDAKEHPNIPDAQEKAKKAMIEVAHRTGVPTIPKPRPLPAPAPKPSVVARTGSITSVAEKVSITSTTPKPQSATVHISQAKSTDYRKLGMYALGAVVAFLVLKKIRR